MQRPAATLNPGRSGHALFSLRDLHYHYADGTAGLAGINLDILPGDRLALLGCNGAGKTTLAKHLNGLLAPGAGGVEYQGQKLAGSHRLRARLEVGLLFQDPDDQLFCNSLREDVLFGPLNQGLEPAAAARRAEAALTEVDLAGEADRLPHTLSYGQRKRAALATLLAMQPAVLVLDEPTANLDPLQEQLLLERLRAFPGTLICITHNLLFACQLCTRAVVLQDGKVLHDCTLAEFVAHQPSLWESGLDFHDRCTIGPSLPGTLSTTTTRLPDAADRPPPLLRMSGYSYRYPDGRQALRDLSLSIHSGERLAIVGENGAGKSTLAACLAGLRHGRGTLALAGRAVTRRSRRALARRISLVFQAAADQLFCPSCGEEVAFGPRQLGWPKARITTAVTAALERVKLIGFEERVPLHLSDGERKRLALATALAMDPEILILDEPTAGLDAAGEELLLDILDDLECTLLLISHDLRFIRRLTTRTLVLHEGRLAQDYSTDDFFADTAWTSLNQLDYSYRSQSALQIRKRQNCRFHPKKRLKLS